MVDGPDHLEEQRRRGLELQGAVPKPRWPRPAPVPDALVAPGPSGSPS